MQLACSSSLAMAIWAAIVSVVFLTAQAERLCSLPPREYAQVKMEYPEYLSAFQEVERHAVAVWVSGDDELGAIAATLVSSCDEASRLVVVVNGLESQLDGCQSDSSGEATAERYAAFVGAVAALVGSRRVLYVLEPGVVDRELEAQEVWSDFCGSRALSGLKTAVHLLSTNPNAKIYVDVAAQSIERSIANTTDILNQLTRAGNVAGVALNTLGDRSNADLEAVCEHIHTAMREEVDVSMNCVIDTSTPQGRGLGEVPTDATGHTDVDYFIWAQAPGVRRRGGERTASATSRVLVGSASVDDDIVARVSAEREGSFDIDTFKNLWTNGWLALPKKEAADSSSSSSSSDGSGASGDAPVAKRATEAASSSASSSSSVASHDELGHHVQNGSHWSSSQSGDCGCSLSSDVGSHSSDAGSGSNEDNNTISTVVPTTIPTPEPEYSTGSSTDDSAASTMASSSDMEPTDQSADTSDGLSNAKLAAIAVLALVGAITTASLFVVDWARCSQRPSEAASYGMFPIVSSSDSEAFAI
ncbi:hypothetical protein BBJ28_00013704 [Nothophytophthora sp. Chile5]|nr:hypothetical protein BBJ28_00013704 [Nothophytophthora sp. Chile5]